MSYQDKGQPQTVVVVRQDDEPNESKCCAGTTGFLLSFFFSPIFGACGLCCFRSSKGKGGVLVGSSCGTLLAGIGIIVGWYILSKVYTSADDILSATGVSSSSGITTPGYYWTNQDGTAFPCELDGTDFKYQGNFCTFESAAEEQIHSLLTSDVVSESFDMIVKILLYVGYGYGAVVVVKKDGAVKAKSPGFSVTSLDVERIAHAFDSPKETRLTYGLTIGDTNYKAVRCDSMSIYAKGDDGRGGVIVGRTTSHYIVGLYDNTMLSSVAAEAVEKLAEYFRKKNK
ncbi:MAG: hypothetical protein SGCHY_001744 [Lobulomycetales sp.]